MIISPFKGSLKNNFPISHTLRRHIRLVLTRKTTRCIGIQLGFRSFRAKSYLTAHCARSLGINFLTSPKKKYPILLLLVYPAMARAAPSLGNFRDLVNFLVYLLNQSIVVLLGLGVVYLLFGIMKTVMHADNEQIRSDGRQMMLYGVVALFVIISMWGLVNVLVSTFFGGSVPRLP